MKYTIVLVAIAGLLSGCSRGPAKVSVVNHSGVTLSNVWISGPHFAQSLGSLSSGMEASLVVDPGGEARAWLSYEAGGKKIDSGGTNYFQLGWTRPVLVTIGADMKLTSPNGIKSN